MAPKTGVTGLEPATLGVTGRYSNQLSYTPNITASDLALVYGGDAPGGNCTCHLSPYGSGRIRTYDLLLVRQTLLTPELRNLNESS